MILFSTTIRILIIKKSSTRFRNYLRNIDIVLTLLETLELPSILSRFSRDEIAKLQLFRLEISSKLKKEIEIL